LAGRLTIIGGSVMGLMTALQQGTVYDIGRFTPARFVAEGADSS
jgi:hypothetical protein